MKVFLRKNKDLETQLEQTNKRSAITHALLNEFKKKFENIDIEK